MTPTVTPLPQNWLSNVFYEGLLNTLKSFWWMILLLIGLYILVNWKMFYRLFKKIVWNKKDSQEKVCPQCGGNILMKKGKYGSFIACSNYPKCRYTKDI